MIAIVTNLRPICERHRSIRVSISCRLTFCSLTGYHRQSQGVKNLEKSTKNSSRPLCTFAKQALSSTSKMMVKKLTFRGVKVPLTANFSLLFLSLCRFSLRSSKGRTSWRSSTRAVHHRVLHGRAINVISFSGHELQAGKKRFLQLR